MTTPTTAELLKYADLQMAAEAFLVNPDGTVRTDIKEALTDGNKHASKFTETQADNFLAHWEVVDQRANTETGFAWGQIRDMEEWYANLILNGKLTQPFSLTGYSLGGHLATVFNQLHPNRAQQVVTFNGAGVGGVALQSHIADLLSTFTYLAKNENGAAFQFEDPSVAAIYACARTAINAPSHNNTLVVNGTASLHANADYAGDLFVLVDGKQFSISGGLAGAVQNLEINGQSYAMQEYVAAHVTESVAITQSNNGQPQVLWGGAGNDDVFGGLGVDRIQGGVLPKSPATPKDTINSIAINPIQTSGRGVFDALKLCCARHCRQGRSQQHPRLNHRHPHPTLHATAQ